MAARLRLKHQDEVRAKIQASQLVNRLYGHAIGEVEMSTSQVQAAKILLDKVVSNAPTVIAGDDESPLRIVGYKERLGTRLAALTDARTTAEVDRRTH